MANKRKGLPLSGSMTEYLEDITEDQKEHLKELKSQGTPKEEIEQMKEIHSEKNYATDEAWGLIEGTTNKYSRGGYKNDAATKGYTATPMKKVK